VNEDKTHCHFSAAKKDKLESVDSSHHVQIVCFVTVTVGLTEVIRPSPPIRENSSEDYMRFTVMVRLGYH